MADLRITNTASQEEIEAGSIPFWQFSIARKGLVDGLVLASALMAQAESGNHMDASDAYNTAAQLVAVLAASLQKSTEP